MHPGDRRAHVLQEARIQLRVAVIALGEHRKHGAESALAVGRVRLPVVGQHRNGDRNTPLEQVSQDACLVGEPSHRIGRAERGDLLQDITVPALRCHIPDPRGCQLGDDGQAEDSRPRPQNLSGSSRHAPEPTAFPQRLRAALSAGLQGRRCEEPAAAGPAGPLPEPAAEVGDWRDWPWSLMDYLPSAARAAGGHPSLVIWHFQLPSPES